jgi:hypothetical protein
VLLGAGNDSSSHVRTMRPAPIINLALGRKAAAAGTNNHQIIHTGGGSIDNAWKDEGVSRNQFMREILSTIDIGGNDHQNQQYNTAVESEN